MQDEAKQDEAKQDEEKQDEAKQDEEKQDEAKQGEEKQDLIFVFADGAPEEPSAEQIALRARVLPTVRFIGNFPLTHEEYSKVMTTFTFDENQKEKEPIGRRRHWKDGAKGGFGRSIFDGILI